MSMPEADDNDAEHTQSRSPILYIVLGVVALVVTMVILHLTGVVG